MCSMPCCLLHTCALLQVCTSAVLYLPFGQMYFDLRILVSLFGGSFLKYFIAPCGKFRLGYLSKVQ